MKEKAQTFLETVLKDIVPNGFEIITETNEMGTTFVVIPKITQDYDILIGFQGRNARMWRNLLKVWCRVNARGFRTNILIPNANLIKDESGT